MWLGHRSLPGVGLGLATGCGPWAIEKSPRRFRERKYGHRGAVCCSLLCLRCLRCRGRAAGSSAALFQWLRGLGAEGLDSIHVAPSREPGAGLAVFASCDLSPGQEVCKVPADAILTARAEGASSERSEWTQEALLAERLLQELRLEEASAFSAYVQLLPALPSAHPLSASFWDLAEAELEELLAGSVHGLRVAREVRRAHVSNLALLRGEDFSEEESRWALAMVDSRAFTFQPDRPSEQLALVPLLDLFNNRTLRSPDMDDGQLWQCSFEPDGPVKEGATLVAERPVNAGDEVFHLYNTNSSAMLWMLYGYLEDGEGENLFEAAGLEVDLDELAAAQRQALRTLEADSIDEDGSKLTFELPNDAQVGGDLMPLARLLASNSASQVQQLANVFANGGPPQDFGLPLELAARRLVGSWLRQALDASAAAERQLHDRDLPPELCRLAAQLLQRERPVLELELQATERFCNAASQSPNELREFVAEYWTEEGGWMGAG
ncbi:unnamed protein product [Effrenium voratum]|nr:unnamed protein product [Effrenium voratum]CAJ1430064.1 unnamed protein product [Effrenium voratum]